MQPHKKYVIHFKHHDIASAQAGVDVCLAINVLELPLHIVINDTAWQYWHDNNQSFATQLASLLEFEEVTLSIATEENNNLTSVNFELINTEELKQLFFNSFSLTF